jgi:hypothetical protein
MDNAWPRASVRARCCGLLPLHAPLCAAHLLAPHSRTSRAPTCTAHSLAPRSRPSCASPARSSLLSPTCRAPHPNHSPCFGRAPRCPLPPVAHAATNAVFGGARALPAATRRWIPPKRPESTGPGLLLPYVANVCFKCFRCFRDMF